ncbi:MAG: PorT family protein [Salinivirgaceae bacterium]|nr:PorT family protein [Salinivirgaceae bacterium]
MMRSLLVLLIAAAPFFAWAQEFGGSIDAGFVVSQLDGDRRSGYKKAGFALGGSVSRFLVKDCVGARLGLRYVRKGSHEEESEHTSFYKVELHYAELPLTAFYRWNKFDFEAGISTGYLIKAKEDTDGYGLREPNPDFRRFDVSAIAQLRYNLFGSLWANASLNYSILAVRKHHTAQDGHIISGQHNNLIIIGLNYDLK